MKEKLLVSLDGTIESLVTAWLLKKQGFQLRAVIFDVNQDAASKSKIQEKALEYEKKLSIPVQVYDGHREAFEAIEREIRSGVKKGFRYDIRTVYHQKFVFPKLIELKEQFHFDKIATGHRVSLQVDPIQNQMKVLRYHTPAQDEAALLLGMPKHHLSSLIFPLGFIPLSMIQKLASELELSTEQIPMHLGLDLVPELKDALIYDVNGAYVGMTESNSALKIGDRFEQSVVVKMESSDHQIVVDSIEERQIREVWFEDANWFSGDDLGFKFRNGSITWGDHTRLYKANFIQFEGKGIKAFLEEPIRGSDANLFSGDVALWVDHDQILGGGRVVNCL